MIFWWMVAFLSMTGAMYFIANLWDCYLAYQEAQRLHMYDEARPIMFFAIREGVYAIVCLFFVVMAYSELMQS